MKKRPSVRRQLEDLRLWLLAISLSNARMARYLDRVMYDLSQLQKPKKRRKR